MAAPAKASHAGRNAGIAVTVVIILIIISGFVPYLTALHVVETPYPAAATSTYTNYAN
ncbi:MAG: hypothetical protein ABSB29_05130 [Nitrososphaerales archaeon]